MKRILIIILFIYYGTIYAQDTTTCSLHLYRIDMLSEGCKHFNRNWYAFINDSLYFGDGINDMPMTCWDVNTIKEVFAPYAEHKRNILERRINKRYGFIHSARIVFKTDNTGDFLYINSYCLKAKIMRFTCLSNRDGTYRKYFMFLDYDKNSLKGSYTDLSDFIKIYKTNFYTEKLF